MQGLIGVEDHTGLLKMEQLIRTGSVFDSWEEGLLQRSLFERNFVCGLLVDD